MILRRSAGRRLALRRRVGWRGTWVVVLAAAVLGGCTGSGGESATGSPLPADRWPAEELAPATPIRVGWVPDGYTLDIAEEGTRPPLLSDDSSGTIDPSLLLAPDDWDGSLGDVIAVGAVDCAGMQGGCSQALEIGEAYAGSEGVEVFELDGRPATYREATGPSRSEGWPQVSVELDDVDPERETADGDGPAWALRVAAPSASRELLTEVLAAASLDDDRLPVLSDVPDGWEVVSRTTAAQVDAADGHVVRWQDGRVAADGYVLTWFGPGASGPGARPTRLTVVSVDGSGSNLAALAALRGHASAVNRAIDHIEEVEIGGRAGWLSEGADSAGVVMALDGGGVVVVNAVGDDRLAMEDVRRVAESIEEIGGAAWQEQVEDLNGGPGLHPDPARLELARGTFEGTEWLVQGSRPDGPVDTDGVAGVPGPSWPDGCILLGDTRRVCESETTDGGPGALSGRTYYGRDDSGAVTEGPVFVLGLVGPEVASVRIERPGGAEVVDTLALPDSTARVYVVPFAVGEQGTPIVHLDADGAPLPG